MWWALSISFALKRTTLKKTRKLGKFGNYFLPSETHLPVVILTTVILFQVIALLRKLLEKNIRIMGSELSLAPLLWSTQFFRSGIILELDFGHRETERQRKREKKKFMSWFRINSAISFKIKDLQQYQKQFMVSTLIKNDYFVFKSTRSRNCVAMMFRGFPFNFFL